MILEYKLADRNLNLKHQQSSVTRFSGKTHENKLTSSQSESSSLNQHCFPSYITLVRCYDRKTSESWWNVTYASISSLFDVYYFIKIVVFPKFSKAKHRALSKRSPWQFDLAVRMYERRMDDEAGMPDWLKFIPT